MNSWYQGLLLLFLFHLKTPYLSLHVQYGILYRLNTVRKTKHLSQLSQCAAAKYLVAGRFSAHEATNSEGSAGTKRHIAWASSSSTSTSGALRDYLFLLLFIYSIYCGFVVQLQQIHSKFATKALSNGDISGDLEWPLTAPNYLNLYILHRFSYLRNGYCKCGL